MLSLFAKHAASRSPTPGCMPSPRIGPATWRSPTSASVWSATCTTRSPVRSARSSCTSTPARTRRSSRPHLDAARNAARSALAETRRTVLGLVPTLLEQHSLDDAIGLELAWVRSVNDLHTDLVVTGEAPEIAPEVVAAGAADGAGGADQRGPPCRRRSRCGSGSSTASDDVVIVVEDDGSGLRRRAAPGAPREGLGLNGIVARANQLGADLEIQSNRGWGTLVRARLPYDGNLVGHQPRAEALWRVLVVNHRPVVRAGLVRLLASTEPQIQVVGEIGDARDVVDAVRVLEPDVVLLELQMPGLDGARLTSYIRASRPGGVGAADRR